MKNTTTIRSDLIEMGGPFLFLLWLLIGYWSRPSPHRHSNAVSDASLQIFVTNERVKLILNS